MDKSAEAIADRVHIRQVFVPLSAGAQLQASFASPLSGTAREAAKAAPLVVLLHGIQGTASIWRGVLEGLGARYRVLAPDLRGRGGSYTPDRAEDYQLSDFSDDLAAVLTLEPQGPVVLVGWSMGGFVALDYLRRFGVDRIAGLVLASTSPCLSAEGLPEGRWFQSDSTEGVSEEAVARAKRLALRDVASPIAVAGAWQAVRQADYRADLAGLGLPALVLHGEEDGDCPAAHGRLSASLLPKAELVVWSGCGHVPMSHDPAGFVAQLETYLRSVTWGRYICHI